MVRLFALRHLDGEAAVLSLLVRLLLAEMLGVLRAARPVLVCFIPSEPVEVPQILLSRRQFKVGVLRHSHDESSTHGTRLVAVEPLPNTLLVEKMPALRHFPKLFRLFIAEVADGAHFLFELSCNFARVSNRI